MDKMEYKRDKYFTKIKTYVSADNKKMFIGIHDQTICSEDYVRLGKVLATSSQQASRFRPGAVRRDHPSPRVWRGGRGAQPYYPRCVWKKAVVRCHASSAAALS